MTMPTPPPINWAEWCCADPAAEGCGHQYVDGHDRDTGRCLATGCPCVQPRNHTSTCIHAEVADGPA